MLKCFRDNVIKGLALGVLGAASLVAAFHYGIVVPVAILSAKPISDSVVLSSVFFMIFGTPLIAASGIGGVFL